MDLSVRKRFAYFDHIIESDVLLPELSELAEGSELNVSPDVSFNISSDQGEFACAKEWLHHWRAPDQSVTLSFARDNSTLILHFPGKARFVIRDNGHLVTCYPVPSLALASVRHFLVDQVLPRLFAHFHSSTVFHASFLSVNGKGIGFLADSGWGKSTIAAGFGAAGHTVLTDDCLAISMHGHVARAIPAYYGLRLLPDSVENVGGLSGKSAKVVAGYTSKKRISLKNLGTGSPKAVPLRAFFLLASPAEGRGATTPEVRSVGGALAMQALLKNSFCLDVQDKQWQQAHFKRVAGVIAGGLPIFSLRYSRSYKMLPGVVQAVVHTSDQL